MGPYTFKKYCGATAIKILQILPRKFSFKIFCLKGLPRYKCIFISKKQLSYNRLISTKLFHVLLTVFKTLRKIQLN